MRKFRLKALSVNLRGRVYRKEDGDELKESPEVIAAFKAGFLEEIAEEVEDKDTADSEPEVTDPDPETAIDPEPEPETETASDPESETKKKRKKKGE